MSYVISSIRANASTLSGESRTYTRPKLANHSVPLPKVEQLKKLKVKLTSTKVEPGCIGWKTDQQDTELSTHNIHGTIKMNMCQHHWEVHPL